MKQALLPLLFVLAEVASLGAPPVIPAAAAESGQVLEGQPPFELPPEREVRKIRSAVLYTEKGPIVFELFPEFAPWHVANFKYLADKGFYRNTVINFVDPNFLVQAGVPRRNTPPRMLYSLPPEFSDLRHQEGSLGMARRPNDVNPNRRSTGTQFHMLLTDAPKMDGSYTIFGKIIDGMSVARGLRKGDLIRDLRVFVADDADGRGPEPRSGDDRRDDRKEPRGDDDQSRRRELERGRDSGKRGSDDFRVEQGSSR